MINLESKLKKLFSEKKFSEFESEVEQIGNIVNLNPNLQLYYATSKALNNNSKKKDFKIAAYLFEKLYKNEKNNLELLYNLIFTSVKATFFEYLESHLFEAYKKNNRDPKVLEGLGKMSFFYNEMDGVTKYYYQLLQIKPDYTNIWSSYIASLNYQSSFDQKKYLEICKKFDDLPKINIDNFKKETQKNQKIKIGFLSADLKTHSVSFFLKDVVKYIDKKDFELHAISNLNLAEHDQITKELKSYFEKWHNIKDFSDKELIKYIRSQNLNIIVDLCGHTYNNRINILRSRCAPIQISWLGYCNSLGLKNMDYLIADKYLIKENEKNLYVEKILYMPNIWNAYSKPKNFPEIKLKKNTEKIFTFGSFNNFKKISNSTIKTWCKILNSGNSRLILKNSVSINIRRSKEILINKFIKEKVDIKKIVIIDTEIKINDHLECYNKVDLALDTFPYPGVTTTFESILMGVPVLTMKGFNFNSRCGESININLGLNELIADSENDYVTRALEMQNNKKKLIEMKKSLIGKVKNSALFNTKLFANDFSHLLKNLV